MQFRRRFLLILAAAIMLATAIEYGLITFSPDASLATGGTIIVEN
jgi:hypothetical protein